MKNQKVNIIILLVVSIIVFYLVLKDDFNSVANLLLKINLGWLLFSVGLVFLYWIFQTLSLLNIANVGNQKLPTLIAFKSMIVCNFFSHMTPAATGGQPFQIYYLNKKGVNLGSATNYIVTQSTLFQIALVLFGLMAIILNQIHDFFPPDNLIKNLVIIGFIVNVLVIVVLTAITFGKKSNKFLIFKLINFLAKIKIIRHKDAMISKVDKIIDNFHDSADLLLNNKSMLVKGIIYNFIALAFLYLVPLTVAYSLGNYTDLNILTTLVSVAYIMLIGTFIPIPGGSGGMEFAFADFIGTYIKGSMLMAMLLIWRFVTFYLTLIIGAIVFTTDKDGGKK